MESKTFQIKDNDISDGYHTFNELYLHRHALFCAFLKETHYESGKSKTHADGSAYEGWFLAWVMLPDGQVSYHLPVEWWTTCPAKEKTPPPYDGHTQAHVLERLVALQGLSYDPTP